MISESVTVVMTYRPALSFARHAKVWHEATAKLTSPHQIGEAPMLVLLYCSLSLEAFISEQLCERRTESEYGYLYARNIALTTRWAKGTALAAGSSPKAHEAVKQVALECCERGHYGLLVRARNKLVHPRLLTEVGGVLGDRVMDGSLDQLINDLQAPPVSLPYFSAAFPGMLTCAASAHWSRRTLTRMVRLFFESVDAELPVEWVDVLIADDL